MTTETEGKAARSVAGELSVGALRAGLHIADYFGLYPKGDNQLKIAAHIDAQSGLAEARHHMALLIQAIHDIRDDRPDALGLALEDAFNASEALAHIEGTDRG